VLASQSEKEVPDQSGKETGNDSSQVLVDEAVERLKAGYFRKNDGLQIPVENVDTRYLY